jgi:D-inositol-3-phosphate glycosyltransferase
VMTAWSNDESFDDVFARQVEALGREGDVLVAISTSGRSRNVVAALETARACGMRTIALLGRGGGDARALAETSIVVPSDETQRVQEVQTLLLHVLAELVEERLYPARPEPVADERSSAASVRRRGGARPTTAAIPTETHDTRRSA